MVELNKVTFNDTCNGWTKSRKENLIWLKMQQYYANDLLRVKGHVFLNDIYRILGMPDTKEGQLLGWVYDEKNPIGDNFIDFGLFTKRTSFRGHPNVKLEFNFDGYIIDRI